MKGKKKMKKTLSLIIVLTMMLSLVSMLGLTVSAANGLEKTYEAANDGDVLYNVLFNQTEGVYVPKVFSAGSQAAADALTVTTSDDGKSVTLKQGSTGARMYWGASVEGLTYGEGKQYTIEAELTFTSNNTGLYFTSGEHNADIVADTSYSKMYGVYGKLTGSIMFGGTRIPAKYLCNTTAYVNWYGNYPEITPDSDTYKSITKKFTIVADGYDMYVWVDGFFFDYLPISPYAGQDEVGISFYLFNAGATVTAKNVVIKKGTGPLASTTFPTKTRDNWIQNENPADPAYQAKDYASAKDGEKLIDLKFNSKSGAYVPCWISDENVGFDKCEYTENSVTIANNGKKGAAWFGGKIGNLKVAEGNKYTFQYKVKCLNDYSGGVYFNTTNNDHHPTARVNRMGVYGNINYTEKAMQIKMALNGGNHANYNYTDVAYPDKVTPLIDNDGFTDVRIVVDGYSYALYVMDASGEYKEVSRIALTAADYVESDNLAFVVYVYNAGNALTVKDASVFKGDLFNPVVEETTPSTPVTPPVATGDATSVIVGLAIVTLCTLAGVSFGKKR